MADYSLIEQLLRYLFIEGNAYHSSQLAENLGISKKYLENTVYKNLRDKLKDDYPDLFITEKRNRFAYSRLKYDSYKARENVLISFYRENKEYKTSELTRFVDIIRTLHEGPKTMDELVHDIEGDPMSKRRSYERSIDYLRSIGVVKVLDEKGTPYQYSVENQLLNELTFDEILEVYHFVHYMANTSLQSAFGYLLLDVLYQYLIIKQPGLHMEPFSYKFLYFARLLNEYKVQGLSEAIIEQRYVSFHYFSKKFNKKMFKLADRGSLPLQKVIPLRLVYDHQYGRWYLIAKHEEYEGFSSYRMEGILNIELVDQVPEHSYQHYVNQYEDTFQKSWLINYREPLVKVKLQFYFDSNSASINFIEKRVRKEGQWGVITPMDDHTFLYEIEVNGTQEIKPWIRSFGSSVEVLEPSSLRKEMKDEWKRIVEEYGHV
jgi:predicted DNA-binding transcriptional regulator YafY